MIITIGGEYGSGGKRIAERAAEILGYKLCDDDIIMEAVKDSGVDMREETYRYFDESQGDAPLNEITKLSSIQKSSYLGMVSTLSMDVLPLDRCMAEAQKTVCSKLADGGNCILLGRCAGHYLSGRKDCVNVFVYDALDNRVKRIMEHFGVDEKGAKRIIKKTDKRREDYYNFFTGKKWGDVNNYDLVVNCAFLGVDGTAELLRSVVELMEKAK